MFDHDEPLPTLAARWRRLLGLLHFSTLMGLALALVLGGCGEEEGAGDVEEPRDVPTYDEGVIRFSPAFAEQMGLKIETATNREIQPLVFVTGTLELAGDGEPGGRIDVGFALDRPVGFEPGVRFTLREGGRTVGAGVVTETTQAT